MKTPALATRFGMGLLMFIPPMIAALWAGATTIPGGWFEPWHPAMIDLDVYRRTGQMLLAGQDFYNAPGLPWIYPPFGALLTVPWAVMDLGLAQVSWLALNVGLMMAIFHRLGMQGWRLSLATTAVVWLVEPVRETLGFGQLGIILVAVVVLDSMPGPRLLPGRILPEGWLTGAATAIKLTPAVVAAYNFFAGRRREGIIAFISFVVATALAWLLLPRGSVHYWGGLISGNTGLNNGIVFKTNQSVMGVWARLTGGASGGGLLLCVLMVAAGVVAAVLLHRIGEVSLAVSVAGLTSLLGSPISWSHHYVWIVPLGYILLVNTRLPVYLRFSGLLYAIYTAFAPFKILPGDKNVELTYPPMHQFVVNIGVVFGVTFVALCIVAALSPWGRERAAGLASWQRPPVGSADAEPSETDGLQQPKQTRPEKPGKVDAAPAAPGE